MTENFPASHHLRAILDRLLISAAPEAAAWLREGMAFLSDQGADEEQLARRFAAARRRLGTDPLEEPFPVLDTACGEIRLRGWTLGDAGRACLLLTAVERMEQGWQDLVGRLFRSGDESERASLTRMLCLLPEPRALLGLALEVGRTNSLRLYAALVLDNPYPASCYEQHAFNQVVLKSLFTGLPIGRIVGLKGRANPELSRMCEEYRDERVAAGRSVPRDIWLAMEPHASPRGLELVLGALDDDQPEHRYNAVLALLARRSDPRVARALADRLTRETIPEVRRLLESATAT
jgi:hypothetical protein